MAAFIHVYTSPRVMLVMATLPTDLSILYFSNAAEFERFLDREHATCPGIYLKRAKKQSGIPCLGIDEAVGIALCFGWIDGLKKSIDETWTLTRFTPRRPTSLWSTKNVNTVSKLELEGRMRPAGHAAVHAAKAHGRWDRAFAGPATMQVPADFEAALAANTDAATVFSDLSKSERYAVLWRVQTATPRYRAKKIAKLVELLTVGKVPGRDKQPWESKEVSDPKPSGLLRTTATRNRPRSNRANGKVKCGDVNC